MSPLDIAALTVFAACWLFYEPMLKRVSRRGAINTDMTRVRAAWMGAMARQTDNRFLHGQLMGHALNSASFFASSNLILIAAAAGLLFGGEDQWRRVVTVTMMGEVSPLLLELKLALVVVALARGLLDFIWAIRQINYTIAVIGAAPEAAEPAFLERYGAATAAILNPALSSFNAGVRGYYFALAAAAWLVGPVPFAAATLGAVGLLVWRQSNSPAAKGVHAVRELLAEPRPPTPSAEAELPPRDPGELR